MGGAKEKRGGSGSGSGSVGSSASNSGGGNRCTPTRVKHCTRIFLAHLFSHVGLCVLIVSYAVVGALLFEHLEADKEQELRAQTNTTWTHNIPQIRKDCVGELWNITIKFNVLYELNWTAAVEKELKKFEEEVAKTAATDGYLVHNDTETKKKWSFSGALLYAVSIITTIGYGDRCPQTEKGKVLTMFYAIIGVPLMLLWLSNIGSLMANTFKFIYSHARCCSRTPAAGAGGSSSSSSKPSRPVHNNKCTNSHGNANANLNSNSNSNALMTSSASGNFSSFPTPSATQVKYSVAGKTCETSLVQSHNRGSGQQPPPPHRRESLKTLDPAAKMVLLECAEYNVNVCEDPRSRRVLRQLYSGQGEGRENDQGNEMNDNDNGQESSDAESVIDMTCHGMAQGRESPCIRGSVLGVSCSGGGGGGGSLLRMKSQFHHHPHSQQQQNYGTPSKVPLLLHHGESGPDLVDMDICAVDTCDLDLDMEEDPMMMMMIPMDCPPRSKVKLNNIKPGVNSGGGGGSASGGGFNSSKERVPISLVLAFVVAYVMVGAACFNTWEGWGLLDSAYFCFISLTTIGLGDLTPGKSLETEKSQGAGHGQLIFCCLYLVLGLAILAMTFNLVQEEVVAKVKDCARAVGIIRDDLEV